MYWEITLKCILKKKMTKAPLTLISPIWTQSWMKKQYGEILTHFFYIYWRCVTILWILSSLGLQDSRNCCPFHIRWSSAVSKRLLCSLTVNLIARLFKLRGTFCTLQITLKDTALNSVCTFLLHNAYWWYSLKLSVRVSVA